MNPADIFAIAKMNPTMTFNVEFKLKEITVLGEDKANLVFEIIKADWQSTLGFKDVSFVMTISSAVIKEIIANAKDFEWNGYYKYDQANQKVNLEKVVPSKKF